MTTTTKTKKNPAGTRVTKAIVFPLTEKEFSEKGKEAAKLAAEARTLDAEFEGIKDDWKAKIKTVESRRDDLLAVINSKKETRTVETVEVKNFETKEVQYYFEGKVVEKRVLSENELQLEIDLKARVKKTAATKAVTPATTTETKTNKVISKRQKLTVVDDETKGTATA